MVATGIAMAAGACFVRVVLRHSFQGLHFFQDVKKFVLCVCERECVGERECV